MEEKSAIHQMLGRVESPNAEVLNGYLENTTRWVFDVVHNGKGPVVVILRHRYPSQKVHFAVRSFSIAAMSPDFAMSNVWIEERPDDICLHAQKPCKMRIAIDTIHSIAR